MKKNFNKRNLFNRSGIASLYDLYEKEWKKIFSNLEKDQSAFLRKESFFRSPEYKWPRESLHNWSRAWEYPYVYNHLSDYKRTFKSKYNPKVADVGSGVTFFPFSVANMGYNVTCLDIDPICENDMKRAIKIIPHSQGNIDFRLIKTSGLPFENEECDAVYCISVIEHIPDFKKTISEIARVLKPEGLCILTCDINLNNNDDVQLDAAGYDRLCHFLDEKFVQVYPDKTIHPLNILTTNNSIYPINKLYAQNIFPVESFYGFIKRCWLKIKLDIINPLILRKKSEINPLNLAVLGLVLKKKS